MLSSACLLLARPAAPVAPYQGGKRFLAKRIIARLAAIEHTTYAEPFIGMGGVFLRRPFRARAEVINDISSDVATLFRILQRHYVPFLEMLRWQLTSRTEFERLVATDPATLTDLERAARFLYLQRVCFGGKIEGRHFAAAAPARFDITRLAAILEAAHERLAGVVIERLPYGELIRRYDGAGTLFYLDPPYWGTEDCYGPGVFGADDFARLAELLGGIAGRFVMSVNDRPELRALYSRFRIEAVSTHHIIGQAAGEDRRRDELIITG